MVHNHQGISIHEPDPDKDPWTRDQPGSPETTPTRVQIATDSDFYPSVSLAALLSLIFILVVCLMSSGSGINGRAISLGRIGEKMVRLHPLLSCQTLATRRSLDNSLKPNRDGVTTIIAVTNSNAVQTLICFTSNLISLLSSQANNVTKRLQDYSSPVLSGIINNSPSRVFHVAVVTIRTGQAPFGIILGPEDYLFGGTHLWKMTLNVPKGENERGLQNNISDLAVDVLKFLYKTKHIPEVFEKSGYTEKCLPVLHITGDPYLESGFVC
ncbi:uncharacterized protein LOC134572616 [Pelobates fuscus]|uniref:uncharacterized protein LOC134572616 n=1 Tax=Pelobates fuscus TaxID=191477 RepID=UPI002FE437FE